MNGNGILSCLLLAAIFICGDCKRRPRLGECQSISRRSYCSGMGYETTKFPNALGHQSLDEANAVVEQVLIHVSASLGDERQCYQLIKSILCQSLVPMCLTNGEPALGPCRELCSLVQSRCGALLRTIPQLQGMDCRQMPVSSGDVINNMNCIPVQDSMQDEICCQRPFRNVNGACLKISNKARPYKSSYKSCEALGAYLAKVGPVQEVTAYLVEEMPDNAEHMWIGLEVNTETQTMFWTIDNTEVDLFDFNGDGYNTLTTAGGKKRTCFAINTDGRWDVLDCRNTDAPSVCQTSNECPYGIRNGSREEATSGPTGGDEPGEGDGSDEEEEGPIEVPTSGTCEPYTLALCPNVGYSETRFPNIFGHVDIGESETELRQWAPLFGARCSPQMLELVCSLYAPPCVSASEPALVPCREVCDSAKAGCQPMMIQFGHMWPDLLNCTKFPTYSGPGSCYLGSISVELEASAQCEPLSDVLCQGMGYTETRMPNHFGHSDQFLASTVVNTFQSLFLFGCSDNIQPFICSLFYPPCMAGIKNTLKPCRELCESSKAGCLSTIELIGQSWPSELDCDLLPWSHDESTTCYGGPSTVESEEVISDYQPQSDPIGGDNSDSGYVDDEESPSFVDAPTSGACESFSMALCPDVGYSETRFPNVFGHENHEESEIGLRDWAPLFGMMCSPQMTELICSMYVPPCVSASEPTLLVCREVCETARTGCLPTLHKFGFEWPDFMNCTKFQSYSGPGSCYIGTLLADIEGEGDELGEEYSAVEGHVDVSTPGPCLSFSMALCPNIGYSETRFPNSFYHGNIEESELALANWAPLFGMCSDYFAELVCSLHAPPCVSASQPTLLPCNELCEAAKADCLPLFQQFGEGWPFHLACESFPASSGPGFCYSGTLAEEPEVPELPAESMDSDLLSEPSESIGQCEPLRVPMCSMMPYNVIQINSNFTQEDTAIQMYAYQPLIDLGCSASLPLFLCVLHVPPCSVNNIPVIPCREMCEDAFAGCAVVFESIGLSDVFQCSLFPSKDSSVCFFLEDSVIPDTEDSDLPSEPSEFIDQCEPLRVPMCSMMPYNVIQINSNFTQEETTIQMYAYQPLIDLGCSASLPLFLCVLHVPPCPVNNVPVIPCREMCEDAFAGCADVFETIGLSDVFQCSLFPSKDSGLCFFLEDSEIPDTGVSQSNCEPLEIPMCQGMGYTHTSFPNYVAQYSQAETSLYTDIFENFHVFGDCGNQLISFVCHLIAPRCVGDPMTKVPPCEATCLQAFDTCSTIMDVSDMQEMLNCSSIKSIYGSYCDDDEAEEPMNETVVVLPEPSLCAPVDNYLCSSIGFTQTAPRDPDDTMDSGSIEDIIPLFETRCSSLLLPLTCSTLAPKCDARTGDISIPCREICRDVVKDCKKTMRSLGMEAPPMLSCKKLPTVDSGNCVMDIAPPLQPVLVNYTRTESLITIAVKQPEGSYQKPGRGMGGYTVVHDTDMTTVMANGGITTLVVTLDASQVDYHVVVTVIPFNDFDEGPATDVLAKTTTTQTRPGNLQLSPSSGFFEVDAQQYHLVFCSNDEDDVMAYPEWSRDGVVIQVEGVLYEGLFTSRYGERTTLLNIYNVDASTVGTYSCGIAGSSGQRHVELKLPCEEALQPFCGYSSIQFPNFLGHTSQNEAMNVVYSFMPLMETECSVSLFMLVCFSMLPECSARTLPPCRELCEGAMMDCSGDAVNIGFEWPESVACENFPPIESGKCIPPIPLAGPEMGSEWGPGPEGEPEGEGEPEPEEEGEPEPEGEPTPETEVELVTEMEMETMAEPEIEPTPEPAQTTMSSKDGDTANAAEQPQGTVILPRRYDIVEAGERNRFQGWADVQGQGAANDYCRVIKIKKRKYYLACALAGSEDEIAYTSPNPKGAEFDDGFQDTWYMKDENGDGRDDFCRCIAAETGSHVSCMSAGSDGFEGHNDFTPDVSITPDDCENIKVNPFLGHRQM